MTKLTLPRAKPLFGNVAREMNEVQNRLRRFWDDPFLTEGLTIPEAVGWMPAVEIEETADELVLTVELPGMTKENVEVAFEDDVLTIRGEKKEEHREPNGERRYHVWERTYGAFQRTFTLPRTIEPTKIVAEFNNGVLVVKMPKTALAKAKGRKIEIAAK
jgi:HSP20 family protein